MLDENIVLDSPEDAVEEVPDGSVEFEGVSFKYHSGAREYALSGVELHIPAGQTVGILGGTGSAKTTLVQLIPRLYDATEGTVRVGGRDVREYDLRALRDAVETGRERRGAVGGLPGGLRRRISGADAKGPGHRPGPGGRERLRRAEAAAVHRPYPAQAAENPDLRRLHQRRGHRH